jgi:hypothetical protein
MADTQKPGSMDNKPQPAQTYGADPYQPAMNMSGKLEEYDRTGKKVEQPQQHDGRGGGYGNRTGYGDQDRRDGYGDHDRRGYEQPGQHYDDRRGYDGGYGQHGSGSPYAPGYGPVTGYADGYSPAAYPPAYAPMNHNTALQLQQRFANILRTDMTKMSPLFDLINKRGILAHHVLHNWNALPEHDKRKAETQLQHLDAALKEMLAL